jgi:2-polyprenyl-3-methyl-5-hydroxy-6-metoxy-1,4-benzoquinol methylase
MEEKLILELRNKMSQLVNCTQLLIVDEVWHKDWTSFFAETGIETYHDIKNKQVHAGENILWIINSDDTNDLQDKLKKLWRINKDRLILFMPQIINHFDQLENVIMDCGYRKHPAYYSFVEYNSPSDVRIAVYQKIVDSALTLFPREVLKEERNLHTDMSRESGIRSAGHMIRYHIALPFINQGDIVLDCACGLGYGSKMMASCNSSLKVIGMDISQFAIDYANTLYRDDKCEFRLGDAQKLEGIEDSSVDFITSFETLEHIPHPEMFLLEAFRVLKPNGKILVSVPYRWVDETGNDPSTYHLHAYDFEKLLRQMRVSFVAEHAWSLTMSGYWENGHVINTQPHLHEVVINSEMPVNTECILLLASKRALSKEPQLRNWSLSNVLKAITGLFKKP